jgi:hypothetical protein
MHTIRWCSLRDNKHFSFTVELYIAKVSLLRSKKKLRSKKRKYWDTLVREPFVDVLFATTGISLL